MKTEQEIKDKIKEIEGYQENEHCVDELENMKEALEWVLGNMDLDLE